jgi:5-enolpyruvylshikimate-3-phosphate synthase
MAFAVAGLAAYGQTIINNSEAVINSCPRFYEMLEGLRS